MEGEFVEKPMMLAEPYNDLISSRQAKCSVRKARASSKRLSHREERHFEYEKRKIPASKARKIETTIGVEKSYIGEGEDMWIHVKIGVSSKITWWWTPPRQDISPTIHTRKRDPEVSYASVVSGSRRDVSRRDFFYSRWSLEDFPVCSA